MSARTFAWTFTGVAMFAGWILHFLAERDVLGEALFLVYVITCALLVAVLERRLDPPPPSNSPGPGRPEPGA